MKKLILFLILPLCLSISACAGTVKPSEPQSIASAQQAAQKSLFAAGATLKAAPEVMNALYKSGKISKAAYNETVPIYNQALASFNVAVETLKLVVSAGQDPNTVSAYSQATLKFFSDKKIIDDLILALGGTK